MKRAKSIYFRLFFYATRLRCNQKRKTPLIINRTIHKTQYIYMCGIVGYIGNKEATPFLIGGLKRLEYRGYDSAGIAVQNGKIEIIKTKGKVSDLETEIEKIAPKGTVGMGHTRWATHGAPNNANAHPHVSFNNKVVLIHNGIIENYTILKEKLLKSGYEFKSETDTEVLTNWIEYIYLADTYEKFEDALSVAMSQVEGAFGLVVMCLDTPKKLYATRRGSPLVVGVGKGEYFIASDATPIVEHTKSVIYLDDNDLAVLYKDKLELRTIEIDKEKSPLIKEIELDVEAIEKGGFNHFMEKEIFEQSKALSDTFRGRLIVDNPQIKLGGLNPVSKRLKKIKRIIIVSCGTSWHAGLIGEYIIEKLAKISVEVEYASEFRYRDPIINTDDAVLAITQSGETADTLAALKLAKEAGALILGICNVVGSSIPRETDAGVYTHAGPEIGVASTKAFTTQVAVLQLIAIKLGRDKGLINDEYFSDLIHEMAAVPAKIDKLLAKNDYIEKLAEDFKDASNFLFLGRGVQFPVALEGALKLKEISYIHAEGYPSAEMKHGPIALIDENMPVVFIASRSEHLDKTISNIQEVKARKGRIISITTEGDTVIKGISEHVIEIPKTHEFISPLLTVIPLQLLAYHIALKRGCNVDQPRNLAKSVTVE